MDSSSLDRADAGFATPAATAVSLALAIIAGAMTAVSTGSLGLARGDYRAMVAKYGLAGAQEQAALTVLTNGAGGPLRFSLVTESGGVEVIAEPEASKLGLDSVDALTGSGLTRMGVADAGELRARLNVLATREASDFAVADADEAPLWRRCARSWLSPYGRATALVPFKTLVPGHGRSTSRLGEVWRLRASSGGWVDDRIVRFTGDPSRPAGVIERRLAKGDAGSNRCEGILDERGGAGS